MTSLGDELEKKLQEPYGTPFCLPLEFLRHITNNFSPDRELGRGQYGVVYKGVLRSGKIIAVKKLSERSLVEETFLKQVNYLMRIKHQHIVQFIGYCTELRLEMIEIPRGSGKHIVAEIRTRILCFEYVSNRSLDKYISAPVDESSALEWDMRYEIIKGICSGLNFLHEECCIVHLDLKPENIMMDAAMMPKIADFGLARIFSNRQSRIITTNSAGTRGYMAPEYIIQGLISKKADIFSLGVIIIEIVTGCRDYPYFQLDSPQSTATSCKHFTEGVLRSWRNIFESASKYMSMEKYILQVKQCIDIALKCVDPGMEKRPTTKDMIAMLNAVYQGSQDCGDKVEKLALSNVSLKKASYMGQNSSHEKAPTSDKEAATYWMKNYPLVGRETEMNELRSYTAKARFSNSRVISVWGIAGIGKSALIRNLYYDKVLHSKQFDEHHWVDVSDPFNLRDFSRSLLSDHDSEKDPIKECRELLTQRQCLIIIDNLRSKEDWDSIQAALVSRPSGSIIIVITTDVNVATYCTNNEDQVFNVKGLEASAAMNLFKKEVHRKEPSSILNGYVDLELDKLILKCGGLPKVIIALATSLATQTVTLMDDVRSLNQRFMHHLESNPEYNSLWALFSWMHSYFRGCPDLLKPCIFYLSIFPQAYNIRRRRLVRRWIAEGYSRDSDEKSSEEQGEELFSKLLELSIIQKTHQLGTTAFNETMMVSCQVNGFIREYIVSRRMEENLVFELGPNCVLTTQRTGRHLIILRDWDRDNIVFESIDFSRLRSLTVFGKWESFFISKSMRLLRVLDLEDAHGVNDEDLKKMVQRLQRLKFISLRGCSDIFHLPTSLGDLRQLQTLDVRHTSVVTLPASIGKLQKLQYIRAGTKVQASTPPATSSFCRGRGLVGVKVPREVGKLTALHTLGVVNVGASGGKAMVEEIKKLTQLRKLGVSGINKHNSREFFETSGLVHLESLLVQLDKESQGCYDDISLPWENLQSLTLYGLQNMFPQGKPLSKLRKLDLEMDTLQSDGMEFLAKLPELGILHLRVKQLEDGRLHFHAEMNNLELETFEKVKILEVTSRSSSLHVIFGSKSMKKLELLKLDCSSASYNLTGLGYLTELKEVLIKGTDDEEIKTHLESQFANHPKAPSVKLARLERLA